MEIQFWTWIENEFGGRFKLEMTRGNVIIHRESNG